MDIVNIAEKFGKFTEHWSPRIVGELNGQHVKLARLRGEFIWHSHENEDEMFLVLRGTLRMKFRDHEAVLNPGEFLIVPRGTEHCPVAEDEVEVMLFEPATTVNTGEERNERTVENLKRL